MFVLTWESFRLSSACITLCSGRCAWKDNKHMSVHWKELKSQRTLFSYAAATETTRKHYKSERRSSLWHQATILATRNRLKNRHSKLTQYTSIVIASRLHAGLPRNRRVDFPGREGRCSLSHSVQTSSAVTQPPVQWILEAFSQGKKRAGRETDPYLYITSSSHVLVGCRQKLTRLYTRKLINLRIETTKGEGSMLLRNVGIRLQDYTVPQSKLYLYCYQLDYLAN